MFIKMNDHEQFTPWRVDLSATDDTHFYLDIIGVGTIAVSLNDDDGVVVDIFSLHVRDEAVASTWATFGELMPDEGDDE